MRFRREHPQSRKQPCVKLQTLRTWLSKAAIFELIEVPHTPLLSPSQSNLHAHNHHNDDQLLQLARRDPKPDLPGTARGVKIIIFKCPGGTPPLVLVQRYGICPTLLRASKRVHQEAIPLLYSSNRFSFSSCGAPSRYPRLTPIAVRRFLSDVGHPNASLIRYVRFSFPDLSYFVQTTETGSPTFVDAVRDNCGNIATIDLLLYGKQFWQKWHPKQVLERSADSLELMASHLQTIPSLKEVILHIFSYPSEPPSDNLKKELSDCGWQVKVTECKRYGIFSVIKLRE